MVVEIVSLVLMGGSRTWLTPTPALLLPYKTLQLFIASNAKRFFRFDQVKP